jgi:4-alpha-glucanotransferase
MAAVGRAQSAPFTGPDAEEIEFVKFVQWSADEQLAACKARDPARDEGRPLSRRRRRRAVRQFRYLEQQSAISRHLAVGAPPDALNTAGQNWGLAGFNAAGLEMQSFEPFREMLRNARCAMPARSGSITCWA